MSKPKPLGDILTQLLARIRREHVDAPGESPSAFTVELEERARQAREEAALEITRRNRRIPEIHWPKLLNPRPSQALTLVTDFGQSADLKLLVLLGCTGCGKSFAASWWLDVAGQKTIVDPHSLALGDPNPTRRVSESARFVKASELIRASTYDADHWDELARVDRLVIDDLSAGARCDEKGQAIGNLLALLDSRYDNPVKTILTTNLTAEDFDRLYGAPDNGRLRDRIREVGRFEALTECSLRESPQNRESVTEIWGEEKLMLRPTTPGKRVAVVACYPEDSGAYKACHGGVWFGYWVRDVEYTP